MAFLFIQVRKRYL